MFNVKTFSAFVFLAFIWGASFIFMRVGVPELSAPVFGGLRVGIAGLALLPILLQAKHWQEYRQHWRKLWLIGIVSTGIPFMLFSFALENMNAGTGSVINASVPMITGIIAHVFFKDYLSRWQLFGLVIGLFGVSVLMYDGITSGTQSSLLAFVMAIAACVCYALGSNLAKHFLADISPMTTAASGLLASGVVTLPFVVVFFPSHPVSWQAWASVLTIALFSTAVALVLFYNLLQQIGPTKTTVVTLVVPICAILLGVLLLDEHITWLMLLGAVIVLFGTTLTLFGKR